MDLDLTEEQRIFRDRFREFARGEIEAIAKECDEKGEFPKGLFRKMGALGYLGIPFPPDVGGAGLDLVTFALSAEELGRASAGIAVGIYVHVALALSAVHTFGTKEQKEKYLTPGICGEKVGAWGFAEPAGGSDPSSFSTVAERGPNGWRLNGSKVFISNGTFADFVVVTAKTAPEKALQGMSLLILEKGTPGFTARRIPVMGVRATESAELNFQDCVLGADALLGKENEGFLQAMKTLTLGRIMAAAFACGLARAALEASLKFAGERKAFGQTIGAFQGNQWTLADMATRLDASWLLTLRAARLADAGRPHIREASMAKLYASETATWICERAVQIHGAYGMAMDFPVQRYYRDCKLLEIGEGTSEIQRNTIARQLGFK
ncbi:MAG: acyl-CoA dehydrogenase family protein [Nitrospirae bacterium]|nr:acyl-CoA dehydrogenase family protein [Nitrospirota bacterium]